VPLWRRGSWARSNTMSPGPRPTSVPSRILMHPAFGHNRLGPKIGGGLCPFFLGGGGSPSNTKSPWPRSTSVLSGILIHSAVWPQDMGRKLGEGQIFGPYLLWPCHLVREVGLASSYIVLDGDPAPPPQKGQSPQFSAHVYCGQTARWIKMALGIEVGLGSGHIVLDGYPAPPPKKGHSRPVFGPCLL